MQGLSQFKREAPRFSYPTKKRYRGNVDVEMGCYRDGHVDMRCCEDGRIKMWPCKVGRFRMTAGHRATRGTAERYSPNSSLNRSCSMTSPSENAPSSYEKRMMLQLPGTPPRS